MSDSEDIVDNMTEKVIADDKLSQDMAITKDDTALIEDKRFIIDLVNKMDQRLRFVTKEGKSQAWIRYQKIYFNDIETDFVKCINCNDIKKHNKYLGTAAMLRHQCLRNNDFQEEYQFKDNSFLINGSDIEDKTDDIDLNDSKDDVVNNKQVLQALIDSNDERVTFESQTGKSEVWNRFERVFFNDIETLYVKCKTCNDLHKQTRFLGTTSLLRHRCQNKRTFVRRLREKTNKLKNKTNLKNYNRKCETIDEKIRVENKTLKTIIKKCLEMIENCLCVNTSVVLEKKHINVLINTYNEWLIENQDLDDSSTDNSDDYEDIFGNESLVFDQSIVAVKIEKDSDSDSTYDPSNVRKTKPKIKKLIHKSSSVLASDLVKRKYIKTKVKGLFVCDYTDCGRSFNNSYNLMQHRNRHNPSKYVCGWPGCDEKFSHKTKYENHISCHTNEKNFKCDFEGCHYQTHSSHRLIRHKNIHTGEKPFKCDWPGCEFATSHKNGLRHHKYRHSGEKPYKCSWPSCEWSFRQSTHLKAHMLKHTGERPYSCEVDGCERCFTSRQAMRFHAEKVHNIVIPLK